ncbi:MAG: phosphatase, partial [Anaerotignum sp.]|nr:phosphatase [Anaerotignum sp.]
PGDPRYDIDYKEVFRQAKVTGTLLEINNASLIPGGFRDGSQENVKEILRMSMEERVSVVMGSDAHFYTGIGDFSHALTLLQEVGFPEELVLNMDPVRFLASLKKR